MTSRRDSGGGPGPRFPWSGTAAIAGLTLRAAVRSRFFASLLALVLAAVVALALTLKGDGTCAGRARVVIAYTLGLAGGILGFATLWNACGSISLDVEERQIRLVAVKPVRAWQVWLGKWMGLVGLNAALLTAAGGATYAMLTGWAGRLPAAEREALGGGILVGRRVLAPAQAPAGG
jgi:ABC-type transport system involved in multi-copper enzyme maturation permease subunit